MSIRKWWVVASISYFTILGGQLAVGQQNDAPWNKPLPHQLQGLRLDHLCPEGWSQELSPDQHICDFWLINVRESLRLGPLARRFFGNL